MNMVEFVKVGIGIAIIMPILAISLGFSIVVVESAKAHAKKGSKKNGK